MGYIYDKIYTGSKDDKYNDRVCWAPRKQGLGCYIHIVFEPTCISALEIEDEESSLEFIKDMEPDMRALITTPAPGDIKYQYIPME